jgi:hypothetical protein
MTLAPARVTVERDRVTLLTSRMLLLPTDGRDGLQLTPVRDTTGLLVAADVEFYRQAA